MTVKRSNHRSNVATHGSLLLDYITSSPLRTRTQRRSEAKTERCNRSWVGRQVPWGSSACSRLHIGCRFSLEHLVSGIHVPPLFSGVCPTRHLVFLCAQIGDGELSIVALDDIVHNVRASVVH